jgi:Carbohydrate family 9 binding domain-like
MRLRKTEMTSETQLIEVHHTAVDLNAGDLQSPEWDKAQRVTIDRYWSGGLAPASRHFEARILWSKKALHIRFIAQQAETLIVSASPQIAKKTMGLWDRDVCEIFIAPDPSTVERYFEFEAAPNGEWLDVALHWTPEKRESDWEFNSHMTTAAHVEHDRVVIAMRIPWNHWIHEPQRNERWRVNLFRCVGSDPGRGYLAWQPTRTKEPNFHVPQVFGSLVFK